MDLDEAKSLFETNYSHVYYILYDTFVQAEQNLKQRGKKLLFLLNYSTAYYTFLNMCKVT